MAQKVIKVGSSAGMLIPKTLLEELGLKIGDRIQLRRQKDAFLVSLEKSSALNDKKKIADLTHNFIKRYRGDLEALRNK